MRAAVVRERSGPFVVEELRDPEPGPAEVLVRVTSVGACHTDLHIHDGSVAFPLPCVLGHEVSGVVVGTGTGVDHVAVGDRVVGAFIMPCGTCEECRNGRSELCVSFFAHNRLNGTLYDGRTRLFDRAGEPVWMYSMGGLGELAVMPALAAVRLPDGLPSVDSAVLGCAFLTAYGAAARVADVGAGATVAVLGAGGVGSALIQVCRALGAERVIAIDLDDGKLAAAARLGATDVVNAAAPGGSSAGGSSAGGASAGGSSAGGASAGGSSAGGASAGGASAGGPGAAGVVAQVRELTGGRGVDVVFEAIGRPATFRQASELCADGGAAVMVGIAPTGTLGEVEITRLVRRKLRLLGSFGGRPQEDLPAVMALAEAGRLDLGATVTEHVTLDDVDDVFTRLRRGEIVGRAVVQFAG